MKNRLLWTSLGLILLVGVLHYFGSIFYFYWRSVWFDGLMHFLGGLSIGVLGLWLWYASGFFEKSIPTKRSAMLTVLIFVMLVGVGWEVFEYVYGIAVPIGGNYPLDTFHDLLFDFLGGVVAGFSGQIKSFYE